MNTEQTGQAYLLDRGAYEVTGRLENALATHHIPEALRRHFREMGEDGLAEEMDKAYAQMFPAVALGKAAERLESATGDRTWFGPLGSRVRLFTDGRGWWIDTSDGRVCPPELFLYIRKYMESYPDGRRRIAVKDGQAEASE